MRATTYATQALIFLWSLVSTWASQCPSHASDAQIGSMLQCPCHGCIGKTQPLFFLHIPKCAGSTVQSLMKASAISHNLEPYEDMAFDPFQNPSNDTALGNDRWQDKMIYYGHVGYGLAPGFVASGAFITVIVRDPIDRSISHWNYNQWGLAEEHNTDWTYDKLLDYALDSPATHLMKLPDGKVNVLSNQIAAWTCGFNQGECKKYGETLEAITRLSTENMCAIPVVGVLENGGIWTYLERLSRILPWLNVNMEATLHANPSKKGPFYFHKSSLSELRLTAMRKKLWADYQLYETAKMLADRRDFEDSCLDGGVHGRVSIASEILLP